MARPCILITLFFLAFGLNSCIDEHLQKVLDGKIKGEINPSLGVPLAEFHLTLGNLLKNQSVVTTDSSDLSLKIAFKNDSLFQQRASDILSIPDQSIDPTTNQIGKLRLNDFSVSRALTLSEILPSLDPITRRALFVADSVGVQVPFPNIPLQGGGQHLLPSVPSFQAVQLDRGSLRVSITNQWNTTINQLSIQLMDSSNQFIGQIRLASIAPGTTQSDSINLAGKSLPSSLKLSLDTLEVLGGGPPVPVSLNQALSMTVVGTDLLITSATAAIPQQVLGNDTSEIEFQFDNNEAIYEVILDSGYMNLQINSSIPVQLACRLQIPGIRNGTGQILDLPFTVSNSQPNVVTIPLHNNTIDFRQGPLGSNQFIAILSKTILASSGNVTINQFDSVSIAFSIQNLKIRRAKGFFGSRTIEADTGSIDLDLSFLEELGGTFFWENPQIQLKLVNGLGLPSEINLVLQGYKTGEPPVGLLIQNQAVAYPTQIGNSATTTITFNNNNSSITQLLNLPPDSIVSYGSITLNPLSLPDTNFIDRESSLLVGLEAEIPMEFKASDLRFTDTSTFESEIVEEARSAYLMLRSENGFPLDFEAILFFLDQDYSIVYSDTIQLLRSALTDNEGKVISPSLLTTPIGLNEDAILKIKNASYIATHLKLQTAEGGNKTVKPYSDYSIRLKAGFQAQVNLQF